MFQRFVPGLLGVVLCAAVASAQTLTVPQTINVGNDISVGYEDPSRAGQTIVVRISVSNPEWSEVELQVHLDQRGKGTVTWTVPEGIGVIFNAPGARQVTRFL